MHLLGGAVCCGERCVPLVLLNVIKNLCYERKTDKRIANARQGDTRAARLRFTSMHELLVRRRFVRRPARTPQHTQKEPRESTQTASVCGILSAVCLSALSASLPIPTLPRHPPLLSALLEGQSSSYAVFA